MPLIYHRFPTPADAEMFAKFAREQFDRQATVYTDAEEAGAAAIFPFQLTPPVVLVSRFYEDDIDEESIERAAGEWGGRFAGT